MIGGPLFEIVLVLFFVFLTLSGVVSLIQELITQLFHMKAGNLHKCIHELLSDSHYKNRIAKRFFDHPMVTSLGGRWRRPTWISDDVFAVAFATSIQPEWSRADPIEALPASIDALQDGELKERLRHALPQARPGAKREDSLAAIKAWFATAAARMTDRYKADSRARLYIISAIVTVLFNVSPIEVVKRLQSDDTLRTAFASAVPELTTLLFNSGQGLPFSSAQNDEPEVVVRPAITPAAPVAAPSPGASPASPASPPANVTAPAAIDLAAANTKKLELQRMLALFHCSQAELNLPFGWPWMGDVSKDFRASPASGLLAFDGQQASCQRSLAEAGASPDLVNKLSLIGGDRLASQARAASAAMDKGQAMPAARAFEKQYGPSFDRDPPWIILVGWAIAIFAGAQGAPFWFNLLKKVVERRP